MDAYRNNPPPENRMLRYAINDMHDLRRENTILRRVIVVLCLLGLGLVCYALIGEPLLSLAAFWGVGAPLADHLTEIPQ